MASMQVLNQSFQNLNNALNDYMANKNASRRTDLMDKAQMLEEEWRKRNFDVAQAQRAQAQSNADRQYQYLLDQAQRAQKNWQTQFDYNKQRNDDNTAYSRNIEQRNFDASQAQIARQNKAAKLSAIMNLANNGATPSTLNAYNFAIQGDPIAQNLFIEGVVNDANMRANSARKQALEMLGIKNQQEIDMAKLRHQQRMAEKENDLPLEGNDLSKNIQELQSINRELSKWYWFDSNRKIDEDKRNLIATKIAPSITTPEMLETYVRSGIIDANSAKIIAGLNNF